MSRGWTRTFCPVTGAPLQLPPPVTGAASVGTAAALAVTTAAWVEVESVEGLLEVELLLLVVAGLVVAGTAAAVVWGAAVVAGFVVAGTAAAVVGATAAALLLVEDDVVGLTTMAAAAAVVATTGDAAAEPVMAVADAVMADEPWAILTAPPIRAGLGIL